MDELQAVSVLPHSIRQFQPYVDNGFLDDTADAMAAVRSRLAARVWWHISTTDRAGEAAVTIRSLLTYFRGEGIDARWLVMDGPPGFFRFAKKLRNGLNGLVSTTSFGSAELDQYETVQALTADRISELISPGDVVSLHDSATAGLAPLLIARGVTVLWHLHAAADQPPAESEQAWSILGSYLHDAAAIVLSRPASIPERDLRTRSVVIPPAIDPLTIKNLELDADTARAILVHTGIVEGPLGPGSTAVRGPHGEICRVDRRADIIRLGRAPAWDMPLVVHLARWDIAKDAFGVLRGFAGLCSGCPPAGAELVLAGPNINAIAGDPDAAAVFADLLAEWRHLWHADRCRIQLVSLPTADCAEHAAIVNALQRHAAVVVAKPLDHGFGLSAAEAMWKARPVIATAGTGIAREMTNGQQGVVLWDPHDLAGFGAALGQFLEDRPRAERLGQAARDWVAAEFLIPRSLVAYAALLEKIDITTPRLAVAR